MEMWNEMKNIQTAKWRLIDADWNKANNFSFFYSYYAKDTIELSVLVAKRINGWKPGLCTRILALYILNKINIQTNNSIMFDSVPMSVWIISGSMPDSSHTARKHGRHLLPLFIARKHGNYLLPLFKDI